MSLCCVFRNTLQNLNHPWGKVNKVTVALGCNNHIERLDALSSCTYKEPVGCPCSLWRWWLVSRWHFSSLLLLWVVTKCFYPLVVPKSTSDDCVKWNGVVTCKWGHGGCKEKKKDVQHGVSESVWSGWDGNLNVQSELSPSLHVCVSRCTCNAGENKVVGRRGATDTKNILYIWRGYLSHLFLYSINISLVKCIPKDFFRT